MDDGLTLSNSTPTGQESQVCGPAVCYRRHHGAPHRLLPHQRGGDTLLRGQDYAQHDGRRILAIVEMLISSIVEYHQCRDQSGRQ